jgi:hypothetical protein
MTDKSGKPRDPTDKSHPDYEPTEDPNSYYYLGGNGHEPEPDPSEPEPKKVGPGFPPDEYKYKLGCPSPNPKGRPRKIPSSEPEIKKLFQDALNAKIQVTKADKKIIMTRLAMGFEQLAIQWAKGDRYARRDVLAYAAELGIDLQPKAVAAALEINHQVLIEAAIQRRLQQTSRERVPEDHVKAPPDLIDDDVTKPAQDETLPPSSPDAPAKKTPQPVLDDEGRPLQASDPRYVREMARRRLAQQRKDQGES